MKAKGHSITACAPADNTFTGEALRNQGIGYRTIQMARAEITPLRDILTIWELYALFKELRPDIVLFYTAKPVAYGLIASRWAGVPKRFAMITGLGYAFGERTTKQRIVGKVLSVLYKSALASANKVFFQNPDDRRLFTDRSLVTSDKAVLVNGSGVDLDHFRHTPLPSTPTTFLLIARLLRDKGIYEYIEAARLVRNEHPGVRFKLVGPFDTNPNAISAAEVKEWEREGIVDYLGPTEDVRPHLACCHVYVLPSYREGTPRTVLEAMSTGRAIITTDAPGCRETVVSGKNGFLIPPRNATALAEAMKTFIHEPSIAISMGTESRRLAEIKYDVHKVNATILDALGL